MGPVRGGGRFTRYWRGRAARSPVSSPMRSGAFAFGLALGIASCRARGTNETVETKTGPPVGVEITAKRSIGEVPLGAGVEALPKRVTLSGETGELDGVHFSIQDGRVDDVWIEDLRTFPQPVRFEGNTIARDLPLADLKALFGTCVEAPVKGGLFFNSSKGVTIGTDFAGQGQFIQLRLKAR